MEKKYKYDCVVVNTKTGRSYESDYCDFYIQDGILTVFRKETFERVLNNKTYYKFEEHYPMDNIERIMCVEK